jgi:glycosyltransferase involved in cell wall biosynthesis
LIPRFTPWCESRRFHWTALKALCRKLGLESRVSFAGYVSEEAKRDIMSRAHVLANASFKEGWGITNIEAALCGTVSVSSDVPGLRDSVQNESTGLLYRPGDHNGFVSHVVRLLSDAPLRRKMEEAAALFGRRFTWETMAQKMESCLKKALA